MSRRSDLIAATKRLLWQRGYESTSPRTILEESGAGQGSFYHHFKGKKELAATALEEVADEMKEITKLNFSRDLAPVDRIRRYLEEPRNGMKGCRLGRLGTEESIFDDELRKPIAAYFNDLKTKTESTVKEGKQNNIFPDTLDEECVAAAILAVVQGGFILSRVYDDPTFIDKATHGMLRLLEEISRK